MGPYSGDKPWLQDFKLPMARLNEIENDGPGFELSDWAENIIVGHLADPLYHSEILLNPGGRHPNYDVLLMNGLRIEVKLSKKYYNFIETFSRKDKKKKLIGLSTTEADVYLTGRIGMYKGQKYLKVYSNETRRLKDIAYQCAGEHFERDDGTAIYGFKLEWDTFNLNDGLVILYPYDDEAQTADLAKPKLVSGLCQ